MKPVRFLLTFAALAGGAALLAGDDDEPTPSSTTTDLAEGVYGRQVFRLRRHGYEGVAWSVDGVDQGVEKELRPALDVALGYLGERAAELDVVMMRLGARAITTQPGEGGWAWRAIDATGKPADALLKDAIVGEGTARTRGAALIAAMDALDL